MMSRPLSQSGRRRRGFTFGVVLSIALFALTSVASAHPIIQAPPVWAPPDVEVDLNLASGERPTAGVAVSADGSIWTVDSAGIVTAHGEAEQYGDLGSGSETETVIGIAASPDGSGYWLVGENGDVWAFGSAAYLGDVSEITLDDPIVAIAATSTGAGYWLAAADGGVFSFGDAKFKGSAAPYDPVSPIVAIAASPDDSGYWLGASDGGVFSFGSSEFLGSMGAIVLEGDVVGMAAVPDGSGYWLAGADGGIFAFGSATFSGSGAGEIGGTATAIATFGDDGYVLAIDAGALPVSLPDPTSTEDAQQYFESLSADQVAIWDAMAECESGQRWDINTGNGFYGGLQFTPGSWRAVGGEGLANQATRVEQIFRGSLLQQLQGWGAWPSCSRRLGLI